MQGSYSTINTVYKQTTLVAFIVRIDYSRESNFALNRASDLVILHIQVTPAEV
jgi:hypothetical protein